MSWSCPEPRSGSRRTWCRGTWARVTIDQFRRGAQRRTAGRIAVSTLRPSPPRPRCRTSGCSDRRPSEASCARKVSGWPKRSTLARAFVWEYSYNMLKLGQILGQLGAFLTLMSSVPERSTCVKVFLHEQTPVNVSADVAVPSPWPTQSPPQTLHASTAAFWLGSAYSCPLQSGVHATLPVLPPTHTLHLSRRAYPGAVEGIAWRAGSTGDPLQVHW